MAKKPRTKRKFARLKGVNDEADAFAQQHDRRPFVFGFVTEHGTAVYRDGSAPMGSDEVLTEIWSRLCNLSNSNSIEDFQRVDGRKGKSK